MLFRSTSWHFPKPRKAHLNNTPPHADPRRKTWFRRPPRSGIPFSPRCRLYQVLNAVSHEGKIILLPNPANSDLFTSAEGSTSIEVQEE